MSKPALTAAILMLSVCDPALADTDAPFKSQYAKFILAQSDKSLMDDAEDTTCLARANRMNYALPSRLRCREAQAARFEIRVRFAYAGALGRTPIERRGVLQRDQRNWSTRGLDACTEQFAGEVTGAIFGAEFDFAICKATELYRRALWLERYR